MEPETTSTSSQSTAAACPSCLNLDLDLYSDYEMNVPTQERWALIEGYDSNRYRFVDSQLLKASAIGGCDYCSILQQGIATFEEIVPEIFPSEDENSDGEEDSDESDEDKDKNHKMVCIEIRPGRSLTVYRPHAISSLRDLALTTRIEFFTQINSSPIHPAFGHAGDLSAGLDIRHCMDFLTRRLQHCIARHPTCHSPVTSLPKRAIYVSDTTPRLCDTEHLDPASYVTLSHCWGEKMGLTTTKDTIKCRREAIHWADLPQTFQEAIKITKLIGCHWIWIDSLCIIQDDKFDWERESIMMAQIYSNSFLNIATTSSPDSTQSCFSDRWIRGPYPHLFKVPVEKVNLAAPSSSSQGVCARIGLDSNHQHILGTSLSRISENAPLLKRAWAFQERLLTARTLHFSGAEMVWECRSTVSCECHGLDAISCQNAKIQGTVCPEEQGDLSNTRSILSIPALKAIFSSYSQTVISQKAILDFWMLAAEQYSSLSITKPSDRPFALAGIGLRVLHQVKSKYLAGLWEVDLPRGLLWKSLTGFPVQPLQSLTKAPSWSWLSSVERAETAGSHLKISYNEVLALGFLQDSRVQIKYSAILCDPADNPFGTIISGQIHIDAPSTSAATKYDDWEDFMRSYHFVYLTDSCKVELHIDWPGWVDDGEVLFYLLLGDSGKEYSYTHYFLVVKPVETLPGYYKRIGIAYGGVLSDNASSRLDIGSFNII